MKIKVGIKIKPEKTIQDEICLSSIDDTIYLHKENDKDNDHIFRFQNVLNLSKIDNSETKIQMFDSSKQILAQEMFNNYQQIQDSCFISYGQKRSGKSYEIFGQQNIQEGLFQKILQKFVESENQYEIYIKMFVIYNKDIFDLLQDNQKENSNVQLRYNNKKEEFFIDNLIRLKIENNDQIKDIILKKQSIKKTEKIQESNIIIQMEVFRLNKSFNQLIFLDLEGQGLEENSKENKLKKNLFSLRKLFIDLKNGTNIIDFRQSTLTKLLKKFFLGRGRIWMNFSVSPNFKDYKMTKFNLQYAQMVQQIIIKSKLKVRKSLKIVPLSQYQILYNPKHIEKKKDHNIQVTFSLQNVSEQENLDGQFQEKIQQVNMMLKNEQIQLTQFQSFGHFINQYFQSLNIKTSYNDYYKQLNKYFLKYIHQKKKEIISQIKKEKTIKVQKYMCKIVYKKEVEFSIFDDSEKQTIIDYYQSSLVPIKNFIKIKAINLTDGYFIFLTLEEFKNYCRMTTKYYNNILENGQQKTIQIQFSQNPIRVLFGSIRCKKLFQNTKQQVILQSRYCKKIDFKMILGTQQNSQIESIENLVMNEVKGIKIQFVFNFQIMKLPQFYDLEPSILIYCKNTQFQQFKFEKFQSKLFQNDQYQSNSIIYNFQINTEQDLNFLKFNRIKFEIWAIPQFKKLLKTRINNENLQINSNNQIAHQKIVTQIKKPEKLPTPLGKKILKKKKSLCIIF